MFEINGKQWEGKRWYAYGTSMTAFPDGYSGYLAKLSGMILVNRGAPAEGITQGFGCSKKAETRRRVTDPDDGKKTADLITLEVGPNDTGAPLGSIYDCGGNTLCGALNACIRFLQKETAAQIVVLSVTGSRYESKHPEIPVMPEKKLGKSLPEEERYTRFEMLEAIRRVCELNGVYYIPVAESCGLGLARTADSELYVRDNIHLKDLGGFNAAQFIWSRLKNIPLWYTEIPEEYRR